MALSLIFLVVWIAIYVYERRLYQHTGDYRNMFWMGFAVSSMIDCGLDFLIAAFK